MLKGILCSLCASMFFSYMYYYSTYLMPLSGEGVLAYRIILTIPFVFGAIFAFNQRYFLSSHLKRIQTTPWLLLIFILNASITAFEMWLFLWAPNHGEALSVSVGYLLLPLVLVIVGRIFLNEPISKLKWLAVFCAFIGVCIEMFNQGGISWASLAVCLYAVYFALRKYFNIADISSFAIELILMLPMCLFFAWKTDLSAVQAQNENIIWLLLGLGLISGCAFIVYMTANKLLPINLLGLLGYVEPAFLIMTSYLVGESISEESYPLFVGLVLSIVLVLSDGIIQAKRSRDLSRLVAPQAVKTLEMEQL